MQWLVTYTGDRNATQHQIIVNGETFTQAYLNFTRINDGIILDLKQL